MTEQRISFLHNVWQWCTASQLNNRGFHICTMSDVHIYNPLCPRSPVTTHSFFLLLDPRSPSNRTLHTGIPAYANRNGILTRLLVSFSPLSTGDVLWWSLRDTVFFNCQMDTWYICMKINKSPTVSNVSELHPPKSELQILHSRLPWAP